MIDLDLIRRIATEYASPIPQVPAGFELTGEFRGTRSDEWFLALDGSARRLRTAAKDIPRLILRKIELPATVTRLEPAIPGTTEKGDVS